MLSEFYLNKFINSSLRRYVSDLLRQNSEKNKKSLK